MKWAFSDESRRQRTFVMAATVVPTHAVNDVRGTVKGFLRRNQRRVHMAKERPARRNQFLDLIGGCELEFVAVRASLSGMTDPQARSATLTALASHLLTQHVRKWTLDSIDPVERTRDRHDITSIVRSTVVDGPFQFDHQRSPSEPMLWVADAVAWDATHDRRLDGLQIIQVP